ncbi:MAG: alpha/beta hydrolase-fold protein, partial [Anaerolineaceae bacterium]|nr:alpha/beta hydrolase-fold protein [Anaerolineaceae bacterium]
MAIMTLDFYSRELKMSTLLTLVVPDSIRIDSQPVSQRKCLTLLHGLSDDATSCLRLSKVELYAMETGIVVVMPSAGRSMYCDGINGQNYFSHIANEIPEYLELVMGLSRKKENNSIAGISMGGMGAARIALTFPERFSAVGLFSGLLDLKMMLAFVTEEQKQEFPFLLEALKDIDTTPLNPINLLDKEKQQGLKILVRCGKQDNLFTMSQAFYAKASALGLDVTGQFEDGGHEWRLWDRYIEDFILMMANN